jgi:hypothetical protein
MGRKKTKSERDRGAQAPNREDAMSEAKLKIQAEAVEAVPEQEEERRRARTMSRKEMARDLRRARLEGPDPELEAAKLELARMRPRTRADCVNGPRPCMFISCKYNLFVDVNPRTGSVKLNFPDKEIWDLKDSCALDVADQGGVTLEQVGDIMNLTRERVRQIETRGLYKLRCATEGKPVEDDGEDD